MDNQQSKEEVMNRIRRRVNAPNSLVFIRDSKYGVAPNIEGLSPYWKTHTCVALCCLPDCDGETEIILGQGGIPPKNLKFLTSVEIDVPSLRLAIEIVPNRRIGTLDVDSRSKTLDIWTDGQITAASIFVDVR